MLTGRPQWGTSGKRNQTRPGRVSSGDTPLNSLEARKVVTPSRRSGSQKRQVPACGALPRGFVSPRGCVRHLLSVWSEEHRRIPAFGTRVWPDVTVRHFADRVVPGKDLGHSETRCLRCRRGGRFASLRWAVEWHRPFLEGDTWSRSGGRIAGRPRTDRVSRLPRDQGLLGPSALHSVGSASAGWHQPLARF